MPDLSRRRFLAGTSIGLVAGAASAMIPATSPLLATGADATKPETGSASATDLDLSSAGGDVLAHVRDASTGEVTILVGGAERVHHDPELVARLLRVARQARTEA
ncbi:MAG TPA: twin-arginine translocation signal domain-containing protein [Candidatus Limnocylindrales bacterium]